MSTKRSHKNDKRRLTAKERAKVLGIRWNPLAWKGLADDIECALQAHAREAVARFKRKQGAALARAWDRMLAKGAGK